MLPRPLQRLDACPEEHASKSSHQDLNILDQCTLEQRDIAWPICRHALGNGKDMTGTVHCMLFENLSWKISVVLLHSQYDSLAM
jgi:hypothetical protein